MAEVAREGFEIKKALMEEASKRKEEKQVRGSLRRKCLLLAGAVTLDILIFAKALLAC